MSPTSYQTAPPREMILTTCSLRVKPRTGQNNPPHHKRAKCIVIRSGHRFGRVCHKPGSRGPRASRGMPRPARASSIAPASVLERATLAGCYDLARIDGLVIDLLFENFAILSDQEIHAPGCFVFVYVDAVLVRDLATPITQQRESHANLVGKGSV